MPASQKTKRVLLPQPIEQEAVSLLESANVKVILAPDKKPEIVAPLLKGVQGVILRTGIFFSKDLMNQADDLWVIARTGAGVDNVDVPSATEKEILVTSVPGANTRTVAEHALALILALMKQLPKLDREVRQDNFGIRYKNLPRDLTGKTLGLVGLGKIGSELARMCHQSFDMHILAYDPYLPPEVQNSFESWVEFCELEKLFKTSDIISLHIPLSPATQKMIGARELGWMKPSAYIINASRGGVIDEEALIQYLKEKRIAGAGLDVFSHEPPERDNSLKELDNVILTPHIGGLTLECGIRVSVLAAQAVLDVLQGKRPNGIVNPEVFNRPRWLNLIK
ncbi:MAG TPA: hydroxyacid dehydrogenase [Thermodesulfobacteriota bacterium]|nr:hydroxyacid dehydrogenase [Thermodesulfobacteriota bacterium]